MPGRSDEQGRLENDEARVLLERELAALQASYADELHALVPHKLAREYVGVAGGKYAIMILAHEFGDNAVRVVVEIYRYLGPDSWSECLMARFLVVSADGTRETGPMESGSSIA
jgi:hypothetical protein